MDASTSLKVDDNGDIFDKIRSLFGDVIYDALKSKLCHVFIIMAWSLVYCREIERKFVTSNVKERNTVYGETK